MKKFDELYENIINEKIKISSNEINNTKFFDIIKKIIKAESYIVDESDKKTINVTFMGGLFDEGTLVFVNKILDKIVLDNEYFDIPDKFKSFKDLKDLKELRALVIAKRKRIKRNKRIEDTYSPNIDHGKIENKVDRQKARKHGSSWPV